ncbi:hypothetical protein MKX01_002059, partial [Papaver californicum]
RKNISPSSSNLNLRETPSPPLLPSSTTLCHKDDNDQKFLCKQMYLSIRLLSMEIDELIDFVYAEYL